MSEHPRRIKMRFNELINAAELYDEDDPIRPVLQCLETNDDEVVFMRELVRRYNADAETEVRDDLVRAVEASRQMVWVSLSYDKDPEIVFEETPEQVVDRLTKGET